MGTKTGMDTESLLGTAAFDLNGQELGVIEVVYLDKGTADPEWVGVGTGPSETRLAPLAGSVPTDGGVRLAVDANLVRNAPHCNDPSGEGTPELTEAQETELYLYYSIEYTSPTADDPLLSAGPGATSPDGADPEGHGRGAT